MKEHSDRKISEGISKYKEQTVGTIQALGGKKRQLIREKRELRSKVVPAQDEFEREEEEFRITFRRWYK